MTKGHCQVKSICQDNCLPPAIFDEIRSGKRDHWCLSSSISLGTGMLLLYIYSASRLHCHVSLVHTDIFSPRVISLAVLSFSTSTPSYGGNHPVPNLSLPRDAWAPKGSTLRRKKGEVAQQVSLLFRYVMNVLPECQGCIFFCKGKWIRRIHNLNMNLTPDLQLCVSAPCLLEYSSMAGCPVFLSLFLSCQVKDTTRWPSTLNSSLCISCWEADFLTDSEIIWTVQLHFSTRPDNTRVRLRLEKPLIETSKVCHS